MPIVTDCSARLAFAAGFGFCRELLRFFMAGLLCTSSASVGAYRIPWEPAFSFHLVESMVRLTSEGRRTCAYRVGLHLLRQPLVPPKRERGSPKDLGLNMDTF